MLVGAAGQLMLIRPLSNARRFEGLSGMSVWQGGACCCTAAAPIRSSCMCACACVALAPGGAAAAVAAGGAAQRPPMGTLVLLKDCILSRSKVAPTLGDLTSGDCTATAQWVGRRVGVASVVMPGVTCGCMETESGLLSDRKCSFGQLMWCSISCKANNNKHVHTMQLRQARLPSCGVMHVKRVCAPLRVQRHWRGVPCNTSHHHAPSCKPMHHYAAPHSIVHPHAPRCNTMRNHASLRTLLQPHATPCSTVHRHQIP